MVRAATPDRAFLLSPKLWLLTGSAALLASGTAWYTLSQTQLSAARTDQAIAATLDSQTVTALGRLEPSGELIQLSAPTSTQGNRVDALLVKEGDVVKQGQVIAVLDSRDRLQAALDQAKQQVRMAQSKLAQVKAGAKVGEIEAQRSAIARIEAERMGDIAAQSATVDRLAAELRNAQAEDQRYEDLYRSGAISASLRDTKRLALDTTQEKLREAQATLTRTRLARQEQIQEARATLNRIAEVRPVDVQAAETEVSYALAAVKQAQANLDQAYVKAPQDGQILKIHTYPGELVGNDGIVDMGRTQQMYAVVEVYESDVTRIRPGQRVRFTSDSFPATLHGTVERIGLQVLKQKVLQTDPTANIDARIIEVRVRLDPTASQTVAGLTNLQVKAVIDVGQMKGEG